MTLLSDLQTIATNVEIAKAMDLDSAYITRMAKNPISNKNTRKLEELNYTKITESKYFKKTLIIEHKYLWIELE